MTEESAMTGKDCEHDYEYVDDEYGSLADGGSYEMHDCSKCGHRIYVPLPD